MRQAGPTPTDRLDDGKPDRRTYQGIGQDDKTPYGVGGTDTAEGGFPMVGERSWSIDCRPKTGQSTRQQASASVACRKGESGMFNWIKSFVRDEEGATATEYAVMLALIIVVALGAISALGTRVNQAFTDTEQALTDAGVGS
jgi:pilus assembly protein Flp/PilA